MYLLDRYAIAKAKSTVEGDAENGGGDQLAKDIYIYTHAVLCMLYRLRVYSRIIYIDSHVIYIV